jgi:aldose 1-epimerase
MNSLFYKQQEVKEFTIANKFIKLSCSNFGAKIMSILISQKENSYIDITGGYDTIEEYISGNPAFGALCGRYANRIAYGKFTLNGINYQCDQNNGDHTLHGGHDGLFKSLWDVIEVTESSIHFRTILKDGHMGFPANIVIDYKMSIEENSICLKYEAQTDADTIINLAPHSYFNLNGSGTILNHLLQINADCITPIDSSCIPTGEYQFVESSPFDFRTLKRIGQDINQENEQLAFGKAYDHNFVLDKKDPNELAATLIGDQSELIMKVYTSQPGLQLYTCNWDIKKEETGKNKQKYTRHSFVCLEPQHYPDSPNKKHFPSTILRKNERYSHFTKYEFEFRNL